MKLGNTLSDMNDRRPLAVDFIDALGHLPSGRQAIANQARDAPVHLMDDCKGLFSLQIAMFTLQEPKRGCWSHIYGGRGIDRRNEGYVNGWAKKETAASLELGQFMAFRQPFGARIARIRIVVIQKRISVG